ncbi:MAG: hypothetical protein ACE5D8_09825 [Fidelibacterota bacterium]
MKINLLLLSGLLLTACVGPEELYDGLVDNIPTVTQTDKSFNYLVRAQNYTINDAYDLGFNYTSASLITTTLVVSGASARDSLHFTFLDDSSRVLLENTIIGNLVFTSKDSIAFFAPREVRFNAQDYTGEFQCVLVLSE